MAKSKNTNNDNIKKKLFIQAMEGSLGNVSEACRTLKMSRQTYYVWKDTDPEFKKAIDEVGNMSLDNAESHLHQCINKNNITAIMFYLNNKGQERGYNRENGLNISEHLDKIVTAILKANE